MIDNTYTPKDRERKESAAAVNPPFDSVSIKVASPDVIRSWSHGEVKNPETINYRTFKPERGGLFCEIIFGPTRDWECSCGKYKRVKHKGIICDHCRVEVTLSKVRRERMGHIELAVPVSHIWFFKCMPSRIGLMLNLSARDLERILYYEDWVVTDPGETPYKLGQPLKEIEYRQGLEDYKNGFQADMGAPAVRELLSKIDLHKEAEELRELLLGTKNKANKKKFSKRLRLIEGFERSGSRPEWMILEVLPVIPPDLRPLVPLEGGRFATSDLNDLYRRVINRNNRLKSLLQLHTPEVIIRNEKRMLQEAVDALMDNGRHGRAVTGAGNRSLKSLSDMLKGKQGRFRQNLLGKRVDYSGRSVIVVGPELHLSQCGLPKTMALTLFEPFIIRYLKAEGRAFTVRSAKKMIERGEPIVWDILAKVTKGHPVMLNRAPTLHRLSIQAFDPILIEGSAIRLHPLVCTAYNADFDGDQMAVHVPLSGAAQLECKLLMQSTNNIFSPANGKPIMTPTQDIALGSYYLTCEPRNLALAKSFESVNEALYALDLGYIKIHDAIRIPNPDYGQDTINGNKTDKLLVTTAGRCIFNSIWDKKLGFFNQVVKKSTLGKLISDAYSCVKREGTVEQLDRLKALGYRWATLSGLSISVADMLVPKNKTELIAESRKEIEKINSDFEQGAITQLERYQKVIDIWTQTSKNVAESLFTELKEASAKELNPVYAMLDSGARGSKDQIRQLAGMRGLMAKPSGDIIERPILSNFREGLTVLEYFISTHGARKGLADTALKTADSGYMTRKLVDVAQDIICRCEDCGTTKGIWVSAIVEGDETLLSLKDRLIGRCAARDIADPGSRDGKYLIRAGEEFTPEIAALVEKRNIQRVMIRSVLTCEVEHGVCVKCYGKNLATDRMAEIGDALGIIAAQSIGEPGTQLTMRTFHIGGAAAAKYAKPEIAAKKEGKILFRNIRTVQTEDGKTLVVSKNGSIVIYDEEKAKKLADLKREEVRLEASIMNTTELNYDFETDAIRESEIDSHTVDVGAELFKKEGDRVKVDEVIARWDASFSPIIAEDNGFVDYDDLIENLTLSREERNGKVESTVMPHREDLHPQIIIRDSMGEALSFYLLPAGATVIAKKGDPVRPGVILARIPGQQMKTKDITGGLPRVAELFEARTPREIAEISRIDGIVEFGKTQKSRRQVFIRNPEDTSEDGKPEEHLIPTNKHLLVSKGDFVKKGDKLTSGSVVPQTILQVCGPEELQRYLVNEVQTVYKSQGVEINDKHIEIIIRQMMQKIHVTAQGGTEFLEGEQVDRYDFKHANEEAVAKGLQPAQGEPVLLGITKASLETESFISSASFQDTTRILTDAATLGKVDKLRGFKENVITGHLIPAGTGSLKYQNVFPERLAPELPPEVPELGPEEEDDETDNIRSDADDGYVSGGFSGAYSSGDDDEEEEDSFEQEQIFDADEEDTGLEVNEDEPQDNE